PPTTGHTPGGRAAPAGIPVLCLVALIACGREPPGKAPEASRPDSAAVAAEPPTDTVARTPSLDQLSRLGSQRWSFDLDSLVARRVIRVLVTPNRMAYFLDGPRQRGSAYEAVQEVERELNRSLGSKTLQVECFFIPVPRDELLSRLADGRGDLAVGLIRPTPERRARRDLSVPVFSGAPRRPVAG